MANTAKYRMKHETRALSSNATATIQIPSYGKIFSLALHFMTSAGATVTEAAIRSEIANLRLAINGVDHVNCTPAELLDLYEHLGPNVGVNGAVAGAVELNVGRLVYTDPVAREIFGFGTQNVESIQVEVRAGTLSTIALVEAHTERNNASETLGMRMRYLSYTRPYNAVGEDTFDTLPTDPDSSYLTLMVSAGASGAISQGSVKVNNLTLKDPAAPAVNNLMSSNNRLVPVPGYYHYDFMDGLVSSRLPLADVKDLRIQTTFSTAPGAAGYRVAALSVVNLPASA